MSIKTDIEKAIIAAFTEEDALFMRPYALPAQVTEAIRRARKEQSSLSPVEWDNIDRPSLDIILEFHLDDVLGHGEESAFTGEKE